MLDCPTVHKYGVSPCFGGLRRSTCLRVLRDGGGATLRIDSNCSDLTRSGRHLNEEQSSDHRSSLRHSVEFSEKKSRTPNAKSSSYFLYTLLAKIKYWLMMDLV